MEGGRLISILDRIDCMKEVEKIVCASNELEGLHISNKPTFIIANSDPAHMNGEHWISFYIYKAKGEMEYFDSFAKPPEYYNKQFSNFLKKHCETYTKNTKVLQSNNTNLCGGYCIFYLYQKCHRMSMSLALNLFSRDKRCNDRIVSRFLCHRFSFCDGLMKVKSVLLDSS
jgi:hypothetical protein